MIKRRQFTLLFLITNQVQSYHLERDIFDLLPFPRTEKWPLKVKPQQKGEVNILNKLRMLTSPAALTTVNLTRCRF